MLTKHGDNWQLYAICFWSSLSVLTALLGGKKKTIISTKKLEMYIPGKAGFCIAINYKHVPKRTTF